MSYGTVCEKMMLVYLWGSVLKEDKGKRDEQAFWWRVFVDEWMVMMLLVWDSGGFEVGGLWARDSRLRDGGLG